MKTDNCSLNANCINLIGSFRCQCRHGFQGDGYVCEGTNFFLNFK